MQAKQENPLKKTLASAGIGLNDFAAVAGVDVSAVYRVFSGSAGRLSSSIVDALNAFGMDGENVRKDYENYRAERAREALAERNVIE